MVFLLMIVGVILLIAVIGGMLAVFLLNRNRNEKGRRQ